MIFIETKKSKEIRIGYARVSKSDDSQNESLNEQIKLLEINNCEFVFYEKGSGGNDGRKEFNKAIEKAKELSEKYNVSLVCYRLDRLGRNPRLILNVLEELEELNINIISLNEGLDSNYKTGKMMIQRLSVVSNWELMSIRERVKKGVENARKRGKRLGRPPVTKSQKNKLIRLYQLNQYTVKETAQICEMEVSTAYKYLKQANIQRRR